MQKNRTFYAKRNIVFGTVNKLITMLLPFAIRTLTIQKLGAEYLGLGSLFTSILQTLSVAEMGFSSAIVFKMYKPLADGDNDKICALLALYRRVYRYIGLGILVVGVALTPFVQYLISGSYPSDINIHILFLIYLSGTVISYVGVAYKTSLLSATMRQDIVSNVDTVLTIVRSIVQIVMLCLFKNYYAYIIWTPVSTLFNNILIGIISKKLYPEFECRGKIEKEELKDIATQIKGLAIGKLSLVSRNSFDSIAISVFCGLVVVTIYSNYYYIFTAIAGFMSIIITGITSGIGNSLVTKPKEDNYTDFKKFNFYYIWIASWCTVCLYCLYQPFMALWVGEDLMAEHATMILFCVYFYISQIGQIRGAYSSAAGIWWEFRWLEILEACLNLVLNFSLGYFWGMNGILIATIVTVTISSVIGFGIKTVRRIFNKSCIEYFVRIGIYTILTILSCFITSSICKLFNVSALWTIAVRCVVCIVVPNTIYLICSLIHNEHRIMLKNALRIIAIRKHN